MKLTRKEIEDIVKPFENLWLLEYSEQVIKIMFRSNIFWTDAYYGKRSNPLFELIYDAGNYHIKWFCNSFILKKLHNEIYMCTWNFIDESDEFRKDMNENIILSLNQYKNKPLTKDRMVNQIKDIIGQESLLLKVIKKEKENEKLDKIGEDFV